MGHNKIQDATTIEEINKHMIQDKTRSNEMSRKNTIKTWTHQTSKE